MKKMVLSLLVQVIHWEQKNQGKEELWNQDLFKILLVLNTKFYKIIDLEGVLTISNLLR